MSDAYLTLDLPPGVAKGGTDYNTKGRWADSQLVRYYAGTHQPVGGWVRMQDATGAANIAALTGVPRACLAWRPNPASSTDDGPPYIGIGTTQKLYVIAGQTLYDITPAGFTVGQADSAYGGGAGGWGFSTWGTGAWGVGGTAATFTWATTWSLDTLGQFLVGMATSDGILYVWQANPANPAAKPTWGPTFTGSLVTSGATAGSSPTIALTATTLTGTILEGQTFIIGGITYTALSAATAVANVLTVTVSPLAPAAGIPGGTAVSGTDAQAPSGRCTFVTPEGYLMVGGANGVARQVSWADRRSFTQWGATPTNTAGDFPLATAGKILAGKRTRNQTLIWTDVDVWAATWIGGILVYRFDQVGDHCGAISPNAMTVSGTQGLWMGNNSFWVYDGYTRQLPCPCKDFVFNNINAQQVAKIWCMPIPEFGEVWWFYPSVNSSEIDSYVMYSQWESEVSGQPVWYLGTLTRTCGSAEQAFGTAQYPIMVAPTGEIYNHEYGSSRTGAATAFLQSGPVELGQGDKVYSIKQIIADEKTLGDTNFSITFALYPGLPSTGSTSMGVNPQTVTIPRFTTAPTDVRVMARQAEIKFAENQAVQWRVGKPRLKVAAGGPR